MIPSADNHNWPLYTIGPQETGVWGSALPVVAALEAAFPSDPTLVYMGANYVSIGVISEGVTLRFKAPPEMSDGDARDAAWEILDDAVPGVFDRVATMVRTVSAEVIAPTLVEVADKAQATAAAVSSGLPWLTVALVAAAVIYLTKAFR